MTSSEPKAQSFSEHLRQTNFVGARLRCLLVAFLMPAGVVLDYVTHQQQWVEFLFLRFGAAGVSLLGLGLSYASSGKKHPVLVGAIPAVAAAVSVQLMTLRLGGFSSPYYAGLNSIVLGISIVYTWHWTYRSCVLGRRSWTMACSGVLLLHQMPRLLTLLSFLRRPSFPIH